MERSSANCSTRMSNKKRKRPQWFLQLVLTTCNIIIIIILIHSSLTWRCSRLRKLATLEDARVIDYVLAHARTLKCLRLESIMPNMDDAFTRRQLFIAAPLEQLDFIYAKITDATIDVLYRQPQLAATLRSLTFKECKQVTRQGSIHRASTCFITSSHHKT